MKNIAYRIEYEGTKLNEIVLVGENQLTDLCEVLTTKFGGDFSSMTGELRITRTPEHDKAPLKFPTFNLHDKSTPGDVHNALMEIIAFVVGILKANISIEVSPRSSNVPSVDICYEIYTGMKSNLKLIHNTENPYITGVNRYDTPFEIETWDDFVSAINRCMFGLEYYSECFEPLLYK